MVVTLDKVCKDVREKKKKLGGGGGSFRMVLCVGCLGGTVL